jgi:hypothetical protein
VRTAFATIVGALPLLAGPHAKAPAPHASQTHGPPPHEAPRAFVHVAPPLPMLPSVSRVRIEAARDRVVVTEEIALPRGEWQRGGIDLYAAFGAPGTPIAVDARLVSVPAGQIESRLEDTGDPVPVDTAVRHLPSSRLLLGRPSMAGVVIHAREPLLRAAYADADMAALRIRSLLAPSTPDAGGGRDVVVRLGIDGGLPLALAKVQVVSGEATPWITRAEATLCGPDADPHPLTVALLPKPAGAPAWTPPTIAPQLATRHASDDLCVRWWAPE